MFWDFASLTSKFYVPSLGGHVYSACVSPIDPGIIPRMYHGVKSVVFI